MYHKNEVLVCALVPKSVPKECSIGLCYSTKKIWSIGLCFGTKKVPKEWSIVLCISTKKY